MQGVVKTYDPGTRSGVILCEDTRRTEYDLAPEALNGSIFRMLRQGQRVNFDIDENGLATTVRIGAEVDMGTPKFPSFNQR